jgi:DNA-binding response OmpR family regulator
MEVDMPEHTLLIAAADARLREFLADQLVSDGHAVDIADSADAAIAKLGAHAIDVAVVADLDGPAAAAALVRSIRAGRYQRIHRDQPIVTVGADDELAVLRAYEAGSDHHLSCHAGYVVLRAVIAAVVRLALRDTLSRHLHVGELHIDTVGRSADINGTPVRLSRLEFDLLVKLASDPGKVFTKAELKQAIWRDSTSHRTLDSHACRLRHRLAEHGVQLVANRWGVGYVLNDAA